MVVYAKSPSKLWPTRDVQLNLVLWWHPWPPEHKSKQARNTTNLYIYLDSEDMSCSATHALMIKSVNLTLTQLDSSVQHVNVTKTRKTWASTNRRPCQLICSRGSVWHSEDRWIPEEYLKQTALALVARWAEGRKRAVPKVTKSSQEVPGRQLHKRKWKRVWRVVWSSQ